MAPTVEEEFVLVTGAGGHIGREVCRKLRADGTNFLSVDVGRATGDTMPCDLRLQHQLSALFQSHRIRSVIHLAAILLIAFRFDPFVGIDVNLTGCFELMRRLTEPDLAVPDEPYGASNRVVELVGETLASRKEIEFVSLPYMTGRNLVIDGGLPLPEGNS